MMFRHPLVARSIPYADLPGRLVKFEHFDGHVLHQTIDLEGAVKVSDLQDLTADRWLLHMMIVTPKTSEVCCILSLMNG